METPEEIEKGKLNKRKEEDRRFLMGVLNQNVQLLQSNSQFKLNSFLAYFAIYLSLIAVLIALGKVTPYFYLVTIGFIITVCLIFLGRKDSELIKFQTEQYKKIHEIHFKYLNNKK